MEEAHIICSLCIQNISRDLSIYQLMCIILTVWAMAENRENIPGMSCKYTLYHYITFGDNNAWCY